MLNRVTSATTVLLLFVSVSVSVSQPARADEGGVLPDSDVVMKAIVDEMDRSIKELKLDDLPRPYFIQYNADDRLTFNFRATYGTIVQSDRDRRRTVRSRVRVGSYELDNTNFQWSFGGGAAMPLDDNYTAIRHAVWRMTDQDYKRAIETLTRKEAFLKEKNVIDRPVDFTAAPATKTIEPTAEIVLAKADWEDNIRRLSARFAIHTEIKDSMVSMVGGAVNEWVINSEGTTLRTGNTGVWLRMRAEVQAEEGMSLTDARSYLAEQPADLPPMDKMLADIDDLCKQLIQVKSAPVLEQYTGPVLFDPIAAGMVFEALLSDGLCARPIPLGSGGSQDASLEKRIGARILPRSFSVYDDPGPETFGDTLLAGAYAFDDEGVPAERVQLIEKGTLKTLLAGRAPTKKIVGTNGHAKSAGFRDAVAHIGCLYIEDADGMSAEELKVELIQAAKDEGLDFAVRIAAMKRGRRGGLGNPIVAYKVFVEDGREELFRGMEFKPVQTRSLKRIVAAGDQREAYNSLAGIGASIIAPAILMEELELTKIEREFDKLPILKSPATRHAAGD